MSTAEHLLLVANRGEIAVRIIRTAKKIGIRTLSIYTPSDALAPHVSLADEAVALPVGNSSEFSAYRSTRDILSICKAHNVTLIHPGYGFISEDPDAAALFIENGVTWLGPTPEVIRMMGIKHEARGIAIQAGVPVVPGSGGVVRNEQDAVAVVAEKIGYPVILKATSGGGGMGMVICSSESELREKFEGTVDRAKALFGDGRVFIERYIAAARHIEIQVRVFFLASIWTRVTDSTKIFGYGDGKIVHFGERECSIQRRHQKVIEESPSPFFADRVDLREKMCSAAVRLGQAIKYSSAGSLLFLAAVYCSEAFGTAAGTVEFIVDDASGEFFFLEMNTRIQVEHPVTEAIRPGLDLVRSMIELGIAERDKTEIPGAETDVEVTSSHAIEVRVYSENPSENFKPCPGVLQFVDLREDAGYDWLRVETWVATGTSVSPHFDPLISKLIVCGPTRDEAIARLCQVLNEVRIYGLPNNLEYLKAVVNTGVFRGGRGTTHFLDTFKFTPSSFTVIAPGLDSSIQDYPGRTMGLGIPRSGAMDWVAFRIGNSLVGNPQTTEGLEVIVVPNVECELHFHVETVVAVTGKPVAVSVNGAEVSMWSTTVVPADGRLLLEDRGEGQGGLRCYVALRGGFPSIPAYLGSKSTSMGLGGYQGRSLLPGDEIALASDAGKLPRVQPGWKLSSYAIPTYPSHWVVHVLPGPHGDESYITSEGIDNLYITHWKVAASSNRMGIRLEGAKAISWARQDGGEGGSHPSNILDSGYALGTVNINGDTPVILTVEGPDMGGYICAFTICEADWWKTGQFSPGDTIQFTRVPWDQARSIRQKTEQFLETIARCAGSSSLPGELSNPFATLEDTSYDPKLRIIPQTQSKPQAVFRLAGDSCILVEVGEMTLDFVVRARIHAFEEEVRRSNVKGIKRFCPCVRSTMVYFDPSCISSLSTLVDALAEAYNATPDDYSQMIFPGRRITLPIVLDDGWNKEAISKYMKTIRDKAVYLPSNTEYLARNNGLKDSEEALKKLISSDWLVIGVGFYLGLPFMVPVSGTENESFTHVHSQDNCQGAIGIAGVVAAIYPVESPGGYQLYGRTLPGWNTWCQGEDFGSDRPWLYESFDQVRFEVIDENEYPALEREFDAGRYKFKIEDVNFSVKEYLNFVKPIQAQVDEFKKSQARAVVEVNQEEQTLLQEWISSKEKANAVPTTQKSTSSGTGRSFSTHGVSFKMIQNLFVAGTSTITSPLSASIWKIKAAPGDEIQSANDVLIILEAMKTEIPVKAGAKNVGKKVIGFGSGDEERIREGGTVNAGEVLILLS
ncbi:hypothetical protein PQX77_004290 [Marasmius sp. AFHP31]|nr:hypothetical protein PQX77_004290 [Marasmius sp. AFHP31]